MNQSFIHFEGKCVVISGASSGIGRVIAKNISELGARLVLIGRDSVRLEGTMDKLSGTGHRMVVADLVDRDNTTKALKPVLEEVAPVYGLCHCAGIVKFRPLRATNSKTVNSQMDINFTAGLELAKLVSHRGVADKEGGSIVFISSISANIGAIGQIAYCASKGAVNAAARAMALELAPRKIRVNVVSPGFIITDMTENKSRLNSDQIKAIIDQYPLGEGKPVDVARAVAFLLDPQNRWITGTDLVVDGGFTAQ